MTRRTTGFNTGGVHPKEMKDRSLPADLVVVQPPKRLSVPVTQHLGKPSRCVVKKGDEVVVGQVLAEADGPISAPVHSPVSGKVLKIADGPIIGAYRAPVIEIMNDGKYDGEDQFELAPVIDWEDREQFVDRIRDGGIVGLGGAAFPTAVKLWPPADVTVDTLIINGCECEPFLTADDTLMRNSSAETVAGAVAMASVLKVSTVLIGIEANKPGAIEAMNRVVEEGGYRRFFQGEGPWPTIRVISLRTRYPQGAEKQLIDALLGRRIKSAQLPFSVGVVVQNVGTSFAAFEAIARGRPLYERVITLSGMAIERPGNYMVRIGTPLAAVVEAAGGTTPELRAIVAGGPMMGKSLKALESPVVKGLSGVLFLDRSEAKLFVESDCIRCGRCVDACPMGLTPCEMTAQAESANWKEAVAMGTLDCVECGSCQYVCPAKRHLVARIRLTKYYWRKLKK